MSTTNTIDIPNDIGCPSGFQETPILQTDPNAAHLIMDDYVVIKEEISSIDLIVQGAHCGGCLRKIENGVGSLDGVKTARMNLSTMRLSVQWVSKKLRVHEIVTILTNMGYGVAPYEINMAQSKSRATSDELLKAMAVAGFGAMNVMFLSIAIWSGGQDMARSTHTILHWVSALIALPIAVYAGRPFFRSAWQVLKNKTTNMDVPISLAVILACALSLYETIQGNPDTYFDAAMMLLFLLLIGRYLDAKLRLKAGEAAQRLAAMQSSSATRILENGELETVPTRKIIPGDHLIIPAGQRIPVDAQIITGRSEIDTQLSTGESLPVMKSPKDLIYSGMVNLGAPLTVKAIAAEADSFLSEIAKLVQIGEQNKSKYVKIADQAAKLYVPIVHSLAVMTFVGWLVAGASLRTASLNAIAVLIITCPCALGLAVPAVHIVASGRLFAQGVLIKSGDALERLANIKSIIFDKTGTLTTGKFELENHDEIEPQTLQIAAALSVHSRHPIAVAMHPYLGQISATDVSEITGKGLEGMCDNIHYHFGSGDESSNGLMTTSWLSGASLKPQAFIFSDTIRNDAKESIEKLSALKISMRILSGDKEDSVQHVAKKLGIEQAHGECSPRQKLEILEALAAQDERTLMVGDGLNDAPALANAYVSASLSTASDISRTAADIILEDDKLGGLAHAISIARQTKKRVLQNLSAAVIYNLFAVPLAIFGLVNPLIAALAMTGSSMIVTLNALRPMKS